MVGDRIEKKVLRAPRKRVWRAISDSKVFGTRFGVEFGGPFIAGLHMTGRIAPTKVDAEIARTQEPYVGATFERTIDRVEPMGLMFCCHPFAVDSAIDYSSGPSTLVEFHLDEVAGGMRVTITESGFDRAPLDAMPRRCSAHSRTTPAATKHLQFSPLSASFAAAARAENRSGRYSRSASSRHVSTSTSSWDEVVEQLRELVEKET